MGKYTATMIDNNLEKASFSVPIGTVDAASITAIVASTDQLGNALSAISLANISAVSMSVFNNVIPAERPTDPYANREMGVVFHMLSDTTSQKLRVTVPAPDLSLFPFATLGVGRVDAPFPTLNASLVTFISELEGTCVYEQDDGGQETVTVVAMEHIGRNL